jgi:hypothetical protein
MILLWVSGFFMGCAAGLVLADTIGKKDVKE